MRSKKTFILVVAFLLAIQIPFKSIGASGENSNLTKGELAKYLNDLLKVEDENIMNTYLDVHPNDKNLNELLKSSKAGILQANSRDIIGINKELSMEELYGIVGQVFGASHEYKNTNISSWALKPIGGLLNKGYIDNGNLQGLKQMANKEEYDKLIDRIVAMTINEGKVYENLNVEGNLLINGPNIKLVDSNIDGNLIIGEGALSSKIVLDSTRIKGKLIKRHRGKIEVLNGLAPIEILELKDVDKGFKKEKPAYKVPVLLYHHLLFEEDIKKYGYSNNTSVGSVESFKDQMNYLKANGFNTIDTLELEAFIRYNKKLPNKPILVSFDDGYLSNTKYAYDILKKNGQKATIFLIGSTRKTKYEDMDPSKLQFISLDEMDRFKDVFEFQSHTFDLHKEEYGNTKTTIVGKEVLYKDLMKNRELLNASSIAYPRGKYSDLILESVGLSNHRLGFTIEKGYVKYGIHPYKVPRIIVNPHMGKEEFIKLVNVY